VARFGFAPIRIALSIEVTALVVFGDEGFKEDGRAVFPVVVTATKVGANAESSDLVVCDFYTTAFFGGFYPGAPFE